MVLARGIMVSTSAANVAQAKGQWQRLETSVVPAGFLLSRAHARDVSPTQGTNLQFTHTVRESRGACRSMATTRGAKPLASAFTSRIPHKPRGPGVRLSAEGGVRTRGDPMSRVL